MNLDETAINEKIGQLRSELVFLADEIETIGEDAVRQPEKYGPQALEELRNKQEQIIEVSFDYRIEVVALEKLPNIQKAVNTHDFDYELHLSGTQDMRPAVFDFAHDNGLKILNLQLKNESLEQLFKKLTV